MISIIEELHKSILDDPSDDTVRLIYADALEENGDHDRAEYIRLQIELVRRRATGEGWRSKLVIREFILLNAHRQEWLAAAKCPVCDGVPPEFPLQRGPGSFRACVACRHTGATCWPLLLLDTAKQSQVPLIAATFTRGFVGKIECAWEVLSRPGVAAAIWAAHPVTDVVLVGKHPEQHTFEGRDTWSWFNEGLQSDGATLPGSICDLLNEPSDLAFRRWIYENPDEAYAELSAAICSWGRAQAAKTWGSATA